MSNSIRMMAFRTRLRRQAIAAMGLLIACHTRQTATTGESEPLQAMLSTPEPAHEETSESEPIPDSPKPEPVKPKPKTTHADLDPSNDTQTGPPAPIPDCEERLTAAGIRFDREELGVAHRRKGVPVCGAEQVVRYHGSSQDIRYNKDPLVTCAFALALADFERIVQEQAERDLGSRVVGIDQIGNYSCRKMAAYDLVSEHSYANALDLRRFRLANGTSVDVLTDFRPTETDAREPATRFLRTLANRLFDEAVFSVVITPYFDDLHRNHIHVDLSRFRADASRPNANASPSTK